MPPKRTAQDDGAQDGRVIVFYWSCGCVTWSVSSQPTGHPCGYVGAYVAGVSKAAIELVD